MQKAVMIDLETLGTGSDAVITSIGAVRFDPAGDWIGDTYHTHVSAMDQARHGRAIDAGTVLWWLTQGDEARRTLVDGQAESVPLIAALESFAAFFGGDKDTEIWCNGASFDLPILGNAYVSLGLRSPWKYWNERCLRTMRAISPATKLPRTGEKHNALHDAYYQALTVQSINRYRACGREMQGAA